MMDSIGPVKELFSIMGLLVLFGVLYAVFSGFFLAQPAKDYVDTAAPGQIVLFSEQLLGDPAVVSGTVYGIQTGRNTVFYFENVSIRVLGSVDVYLANQTNESGKTFVGTLPVTKGNMTLFVPPELAKTQYALIQLWSTIQDNLIATIPINK